MKKKKLDLEVEEIQEQISSISASYGAECVAPGSGQGCPACPSRHSF